ncbi:hypothetical protein [Lutibacter sp.]|uniref:hypothetical protein n=1 Tax=Lutibacter sp. TaxID=1925666 RepID=UPI002733A597|nr:hypothetical protein [Lutibacter sp.]MDP3312867.1 hypothetical protein [Lutibacter sp.]
MIYSVKIKNITIIDEIEGAWSKNDYIQLLEIFEFSDAQNLKETELIDYLFMAITDFEPHEAAAYLLKYKLGEYLNEGQIDSLSHEMLLDKVSEEYPVIELHHDLFNINQLLYKAYNGTFPNAKACIIDFDISPKSKNESVEITKEIVLKAISKGLSESCLIKRLFNDQLKSETPFEEAEGILWKLTPQNDSSYKAITSEYWLGKEEVINGEFEAEVLIATEEDPE